MKIACDIDGTLSNPGHRLHFIQPEGYSSGSTPRPRKKDWDGFFAACGDDPPIPHTVELCQDLMLAGHTVEFWTGRREAERDTTIEWLNEHVVTREVYLNLFTMFEWEGATLKMRKDGDRRPDHILKMEFIDPSAPPDIIFEDRSAVVKEYRRLGLTVFQVAEGDF